MIKREVESDDSNEERSENGSKDSKNEDDEYNSSDESSFDEMSVGIALELPKRANRSKK